MAQNRNTMTTKEENNKTEYVSLQSRRWFWPAAIGVGLIVLFSFFASLFAIGIGAHDLAGGHRRAYAFNHPMSERGMRDFGPRLNDNQSHLHGVVTAVNGSSFTVAGSGSTNEVQTNSSTQYQNGSQVKVNDSVVVVGTISDGKFTASKVLINP